MTWLFRFNFIVPLVVLLMTSPCLAAQDKPVAGAAEKKELAWGEPVAGQSISIATPKAAFEVGELIDITVILKNVGKEDVRIIVGPPYDIYTVIVLLPNGKPAPKTLLGKARLAAGVFSSPVLKPGEEQRCRIERINIQLDMTLSGEYTLFVESKALWNNGTFDEALKATSNKVRIKIGHTLGTHRTRDVESSGTDKNAAQVK